MRTKNRIALHHLWLREVLARSDAVELAGPALFESLCGATQELKL